jgi:hypothetical protein
LNPTINIHLNPSLFAQLSFAWIDCSHELPSWQYMLILIYYWTTWPSFTWLLIWHPSTNTFLLIYTSYACQVA